MRHLAIAVGTCDFRTLHSSGWVRAWSICRWLLTGLYSGAFTPSVLRGKGEDRSCRRAVSLDGRPRTFQLTPDGNKCVARAYLVSLSLTGWKTADVPINSGQEQMCGSCVPGVTQIESARRCPPQSISLAQARCASIKDSLSAQKARQS